MILKPQVAAITTNHDIILYMEIARFTANRLRQAGVTRIKEYINDKKVGR